MTQLFSRIAALAMALVLAACAAPGPSSGSMEVRQGTIDRNRRRWNWSRDRDTFYRAPRALRVAASRMKRGLRRRSRGCRPL